MKITDADISYIEEFVKHELLKRLAERCLQVGTILDENEIEFMFGMYASSIDEFKFLQGERHQILGIVEELHKMCTEKGKDAIVKYFEVPTDFKIDKQGTNVFSFGWFYGNKPRKRAHQNVISMKDMRLQFLPKLTHFFQSFKMTPNQPVTDDIFTIVQLENSWRADVCCVLTIAKCTSKKYTTATNHSAYCA